MEGLHAQGSAGHGGDGTTVARICEEALEVKKGFGGETQYFGGTIATKHIRSRNITLDRQTHDLPPGRYVLLGYTDPVFEHLFYDLLKPISDDLMLFRGYTGQFPDGKRGWTALLLRRYPFAQMGIDDHDLLFAARIEPPTEKDLLGAWRLDALYYSNQPVEIARIRFDRSANGKLQVDCDPSGSQQGLLLPKFVSEHFQTDRIPTLRKELRTVDGQYLGRQVDDRHSRALCQVPARGFARAFSPREAHGPRAPVRPLLSAHPDAAGRDLVAVPSRASAQAPVTAT